MTKMKKLASFLLATTVAMSLFAPAFAESEEVEKADMKEIVYTHSQDEYTMIKKLQTSSTNELKEMGYSDEEIQEIKQLNYEEALYERAQLPENELRDLGHTDEQIAFMKNYDGRPLTNDEINLMSAELVETTYPPIWPDSASATKVVCHYYWEWKSKPVIYGTAIKDVAVIAWAGLDASGDDLPLEINTAEASAVSNYYKDGALYMQHAQTVRVGDAWESAYVSIPGNYLGGWAKSGYFIVPIEPAISGDRIEKVQFAASYIYNANSTSLSDIVEITSITTHISAFDVSISVKKGVEKQAVGMVVEKSGAYNRFWK